MRLILIVVLLSSFSIPAYSDIINVPKDYNTIQAAINAADHGDIILAGPGTYQENINFIGKRIVIQSTSGPDLTIIDGQMFGSVVRFMNNEGSDSILDGFTITNGSGTIVGLLFNGGGVFCLNSTPTIKNNIIARNYTDRGAGIFCQGASPMISNNVITENAASFGGGILGIHYSSPFIVGNTVSKNFGYTNGGGIQMGYNSNPAIHNNLIYENFAGNAGGGIILSYYCNSKITNNTIYKNSAVNIGGGICLWAEASPVIKNSIVYGNSAPTGSELYIGWLIGGYPYCYVKVSHCNFKGGAAAVFLDTGHTLDWGVGNIDSDPIFLDPANGDFHLSQDPCQPGVINPSVNSGSSYSGNVNLYGLSTRSDSSIDSGLVDMGFHYGDYVPSSLSTDTLIISESVGGTVTFDLAPGEEYSSRIYILIGGLTGSEPGLALPGGARLPVNWDAISSVIFKYINTPIFNNFMGSFDATGAAKASMTLGPFSGATGFSMVFAFAVGQPFDFTSNPAVVDIVP